MALHPRPGQARVPADGEYNIRTVIHRTGLGIREIDEAGEVYEGKIW